MELKKYKKIAKFIYNNTKTYISSIYLGGSITQKYINNPHDIDFIFFVENTLDACYLRAELHRIKTIYNLEKYCFSQIRIVNYIEMDTWFYSYKYMKLLAGKNLLFKKLDLLKNSDLKKDYLNCLKTFCLKHKTQSHKRFYAVYRGFLLLKKNTYLLTKKEKYILNILHDRQENYKEIISYLVTNIQLLEVT